MIEKLKAELAEVEEGATPGPWHKENQNVLRWKPHIPGQKRIAHAYARANDDSAQGYHTRQAVGCANAELLCLARNKCPEVLELLGVAWEALEKAAAVQYQPNATAHLEAARAEIKPRLEALGREDG